MSTAARSCRSLAPLVAALAVYAFGCACASAAPVRPGCARDMPAVRIENFGCVSADYYRGAEPDDQGYVDLARLGVRTIVDLRGADVDPDDARLARVLGMTYVHIPMTTHDAPTPAVIEQFLRLVDTPEHRPVFVHCVGGRHRTGVMTAVYRIARDGWTADRAYAEMKTYRYGPAFLHPEFKAFVYQFAAARQHVASPRKRRYGSTAPCGRTVAGCGERFMQPRRRRVDVDRA